MGSLPLPHAALPVSRPLGTIPALSVYRADVPLSEIGLLGSVVTCSKCGEQMGPVHSAADAAALVIKHTNVHHPMREVLRATDVLCATESCRELAGPRGICGPCQRPKVPCPVANCDRIRGTRTAYCKAHERRFREYGDVLANVPLPPRRITATPSVELCSDDDCYQRALIGDLCGTHYVAARLTAAGMR